MQGSLHEMEVKQAHVGQIATHKAKLNARLSLQKGGSILALDALDQKKVKLRKVAEEKLKKAQIAITRMENKAKEELRIKGVATRKVEKDRLRTIQQHQALGIQHQVLGIQLPSTIWIPIRDPQKNPTLKEIEAIHISHQLLYDKLAQEQVEYDHLQSDDPTLFIDIPIDPIILAEE
jgi:hypothetical protein